MNKTITMQEILNNRELLNILYTFREEEEIKDFCSENSLNITPTVLYNLKKTLENQFKVIENANKPLTTEILKEVAGGEDKNKGDDPYGIPVNIWKCLTGGDGSFGNVAAFLAQDLGSSLALNLVFAAEGIKNMNANKMMNGSAQISTN